MGVRFWVDSLGFVWSGPHRGGGAMKYRRFDGWIDGGESWEWAAEEREADWEEIGKRQLLKIVTRYRKEAEKKR